MQMGSCRFAWRPAQMQRILPALLSTTPKRMMHGIWSRAQGAMVPRPIPSAIAADTKAGFANADSAWAKCVDCRERARCGVPLEPVFGHEVSDGQQWYRSGAWWRANMRDANSVVFGGPHRGPLGGQYNNISLTAMGLDSLSPREQGPAV